MMASQIPWERMVQVLMQCGNVHDAHNFSVNAIEQIRTLIPFDQGRVYFFNDNAEIYDEFLLGVDKRVTRVYTMNTMQMWKAACTTRQNGLEFSRQVSAGPRLVFAGQFGRVLRSISGPRGSGSARACCSPTCTARPK